MSGAVGMRIVNNSGPNFTIIGTIFLSLEIWYVSILSIISYHLLISIGAICIFSFSHICLVSKYVAIASLIAVCLSFV